MPRRRHPNKDIEAALKYAESHGWWIKLTTGSGHSWGQLYCPSNNPGCRDGDYCITRIWSTPADPMKLVRCIKQTVDKCEFPDIKND